MGYSIEGVQKRDSIVLFNEIINIFKNGNNVTWFSEIQNVDDSTTRSCLVESTTAVDAFLGADASQKYRLFFTGVKNSTVTEVTSATVYWGTADQIYFASGAVKIQPNTPSMTLWDASTAPSAVREYSYRISFTDRGFAMLTWTIPTINKLINNTLLNIQRPVNPSNGVAKINGKAPVFALVKAHNVDVLSFSIVRELDVNASTPLISLNAPSESCLYRMSLDWAHPNLFDNYSHVIKFPFGFATTRHVYLDEMDMICFVNSSAFVPGQEVTITMYSESSERTYTTCFGDVEYGRIPSSPSQPIVRKILGGGRIGVLKQNGGV